MSSLLYPVDKKQGRLKEAEKIIFPTGEETGPRLTLFNRKGDRCYVACELSCEVLVLSIMKMETLRFFRLSPH